MINIQNKKKYVESWFDYLQQQICKQFEILEQELSPKPKKFFKRIWRKERKNEGGGISYLLKNGKIFDKVGVNKSTVSGTFEKKFRSKILGAEKNGSYWASGVSVVAHMKNPKIPALHFNTRFIVTTKNWFGGGIDATPCFKDKIEREHIHNKLKFICKNNKKNYFKYKK